MIARYFKRKLFVRVTALIIVANFIFTSGPLGAYCLSFASDNLRTSAIKSNPGRLNKIETELRGDNANKGEIAKKLGVSEEQIKQFSVTDTRAFNAQGGKAFNRFITEIGMIIGIRKYMDSGKGDLSNAEFTAEKILDSRGNPTVRVKLTIGDREVVGEVPAGASKGEDEATTVTTKNALKNIERIIAPLLQNSGLDLSKHEDLIRAEKMLIEKAGDNFEFLGANATVPVSWALWKMAASLNNMKLWEYIRWYNPEFRQYIKGNVEFYMNIFNGGLHALKEGETLGVDRIDIQEIMIVPVGAKSYGEALAWGDKIDHELKILLETEFGKKNVSRADEAGFSVKGLGNSEQAISWVVQAIKAAGFKPVEDVQIAFDVAASTFYNKKTGYYEFQGDKEATSQDMTNFYKKIAQEYPGLIRTVEDGLDENDWGWWPNHKIEMEELGIGTIGDDLFVSQFTRTKKGIETEAASHVLLKVNQAGSVSLTIDLAKLLNENGIEYVVSHRSGETLDPSIADLAYAIGADALKTGAPQPSEDFSDPQTLVRRNKYLRMVEIEKSPYIKGKALILSSKVFNRAGVIPALREVLEKLDSEIKIAVYGEDKKVEMLKTLLASNRIITGDTPEAVRTQLDSMGFQPQNIVLLRTAEDSAVSDIQELVENGIGTLSTAKALTELLQDLGSKEQFREFCDELREEEIITQMSYDKNIETLLSDLGETPFIIPDMKLTEHVAATINAAQQATDEFMDQI